MVKNKMLSCIKLKNTKREEQKAKYIIAWEVRTINITCSEAEVGSIKVVCTSRNITTTQLKYPNIYNYTPYIIIIVAL